MPVSSEISVTGPYSPNGSTTSFGFDFKAASAEEVVAIDGDGAVIPTTLYTVTLDGDEGGTLTFSVAPQAADYPTLYVVSEPELTQPSNFDNTGPSYNPAALTRALDRAAIRDLKLKREVDRSIRMPFGEVGGALPDAASRAGGYLGFNASGEPIATGGTGDDGSVRPDLASTDPAKGAAMVALSVGGTLKDAIKHVTPEMFGAAGNYDTSTQTGTDDSVAFQAAIDYLESVGGGKLLCSAAYLVGGLTIDARDIVVEGTSRCAKIAVKNGELGFSVTKDWVHFRHIAIISQGNKGDGFGTSGILYTKGTGSIGHVFNYDVDFGIVNSADATAKGCFSGVAIEFRNALDVTMISCLIYKAATGLKFARNGTGGADFSTTVRLTNFYVIGCANYGIDGTYVYRSSWNVIGEYNGTAIRVNIGDVSLDRCYFENNTTLGADLIDVGGQDTDNNYSNNPVTDAISRTRNVIGNSDWYTAGQFKGDRWTKRLGLQSAWGRDIEYLAGVGTTANIALKYGEAIVPMIYGDDLLSPTAWASDGTSEYAGWDVTNSGFKIATALTGVRGMKQSVTLDSTKTYVIQFLNKNVAGNAIATIQVDGTARTPGVPFTVASTGSKVVRCFGNQTVTSENYVQAFRLMEVLEDQTQIAKTTDRLLRAPGQRAERYASAAPSSGYHAVGERVWNSAPTAGGTMGWVCTTAGNPGTWKTWGPITA